MLTGYDKGDKVRFSASFTDLIGNPADPTTVTVKIKDPAGRSTTYVYLVDAEVVKDATGEYHIDIIITQTGIWYQRWEGTGAIMAAEEDSITVRTSEF